MVFSGAAFHLATANSAYANLRTESQQTLANINQDRGKIDVLA